MGLLSFGSPVYDKYGSITKLGQKLKEATVYLAELRGIEMAANWLLEKNTTG